MHPQDRTVNGQYSSSLRGKATYLFEQQLPVDSDSSTFVFSAGIFEVATHGAHTLETIASRQEILNILGHDMRGLFELNLHTVEVVRGARILVGLFCSLDESVKLVIRVGPEIAGAVFNVLVRVEKL